MNRSKAGVILAAGFALATPAAANHHLMKVVEVFPGTAAAPNAQYIVLQMYALGQNVVGGHTVRVFDSAGVLTNTFTFTANVANGADQAKILIATTEAATLFGLTRDLAMTAAIPLAGGKVCFVSTVFGVVDCVAWGNYSPVDATVGTPFSIPACYGGGLRLGKALVRSLKLDAILDAADDTNVSLDDFFFDFPTPQNNAGTAGVVLGLMGCGNMVLEGLEFCDDGNTIAGDGCDATCEGVEVCGDCLLDLEAGECCEPGLRPNCSAQCKLSTVPVEVSPPGSIEPLKFIDADTLQWENAAASGTSSFTLYRGTPPGVRLGDYGSCLGFSIVSSTADDIDTPVSKQAFTYLVAGRDGLDCEGPLGNKSNLMPRPNLNPCP